jgi:microsomal dipeptidase-like Zn-dependent dipeptidase
MAKSEADWANDVKHLLRAEMARRGVTYDQLTEKLAEIGVVDTSVNIRNKVARGKFTAVFFVQCLRAIGCDLLRLDSI